MKDFSEIKILIKTKNIMQIRGWGNGLAFAGLLIAVGGTLVQSPQIFGLTSKDISWVRIIFFIFVDCNTCNYLITTDKRHKELTKTTGVEE